MGMDSSEWVEALIGGMAVPSLWGWIVLSPSVSADILSGYIPTGMDSSYY